MSASEICERATRSLKPSLVFKSDDLFRSEREIEQMLKPYLGDDPVFGRLNPIEIADFFDAEMLDESRRKIAQVQNELILIVGPGASLLSPKNDLLIHAEISRWNLQQLHRQNLIGNLGISNLQDSPGKKYKRAFFVDWRSADRLKVQNFSSIDYLLDLNDAILPRMISGDDYRRALNVVANRPFRVVPFFDPGPWGGQWMKRTFNLPDKINYAWCFDCVPEENSLLLGFGDQVVEV
ncbi:MAG: mannose-6-phosphate isomerase, partial [Blastocatellia bacterium]